MGTCSPGGQTGWRDQEIEVVRLVARGLPNRQIASGLGVSVTAVKKTLSRVMRRLKSGNRAQLVAVAFALGLLTQADQGEANESSRLHLESQPRRR